MKQKRRDREKKNKPELANASIVDSYMKSVILGWFWAVLT